jgi:hypothetical protein
MCQFITHATMNLHTSTHTTLCFKKDNECRMKLPQPSCVETKVNFDHENPLSWWSCWGKADMHTPFFTELARHPFDVFTSQYHSGLSLALGSNTNMQCGMGGGHVFSVSMYASKSNIKEELYAFAQIARAVYQHIRHDEQTDQNGADIGIPFQNGYQAMLASVI